MPSRTTRRLAEWILRGRPPLSGPPPMLSGGRPPHLSSVGTRRNVRPRRVRADQAVPVRNLRDRRRRVPQRSTDSAHRLPGFEPMPNLGDIDCSSGCSCWRDPEPPPCVRDAVGMHTQLGSHLGDRSACVELCSQPFAIVELWPLDSPVCGLDAQVVCSSSDRHPRHAEHPGNLSERPPLVDQEPAQLVRVEIDAGHAADAIRVRPARSAPADATAQLSPGRRDGPRWGVVPSLSSVERLADDASVGAIRKLERSAPLTDRPDAYGIFLPAELRAAEVH